MMNHHKLFGFTPHSFTGSVLRKKKKGRKKIERRLEVVIASRENVPRNHQLHQFRLPMEIRGRNPSFSGAEREKCCPFMLARGLKVMAEKGLSPVNAWR